MEDVEMKERLFRLWARWGARPGLARFNRGLLRLGLHGLGVLNTQDDLSGEAAFLNRYLKGLSRPVVVDVGAHAGEYAGLVLAAAPDARLYSVEPHPGTFARLEQAARTRGFTAIQAACGAASGAAQLSDYADRPDGSQHASLYAGVIGSVWGRPAAVVNVDVTTVDALAEQHGLEAIDLLKIDTEGAELDVLRGAGGLLASGRVHAIQFEFNDTLTISRVFLRDFREALPGFHLYRLLPQGQLSLEPYHAVFSEIFAYQNIVALPREVGEHGA
jgi:FkbM family methyltransferase